MNDISHNLNEKIFKGTMKLISVLRTRKSENPFRILPLNILFTVDFIELFEFFRNSRSSKKLKSLTLTFRNISVFP